MIEPIEGSTDAITTTTAVLQVTTAVQPLTNAAHPNQPSSSTIHQNTEKVTAPAIAAGIGDDTNNIDGSSTTLLSTPTAVSHTNTVTIPQVDQPTLTTDLSHIDESEI